MASRYHTEFSQKKVSAAGARPRPPRGESSASSPAGPRWTPGGPGAPSKFSLSADSAPPSWKPGTTFYVQHAGVDNAGHSKGEKPVSRKKAKKILREGETRGHQLTEKQKGLFGLIAGGGTPSKKKGFKG